MNNRSQQNLIAGGERPAALPSRYVIQPFTGDVLTTLCLIAAVPHGDFYSGFVGKRPLQANRVLDDRLWDQEGREWHCSLRDWLSLAELDEAFRAAKRVAFYQWRRPLVWRDGNQARSWWQNMRPLADESGNWVDDQELFYGGSLYESDGDTLLVITASC